jgi:hypothetical protein
LGLEKFRDDVSSLYQDVEKLEFQLEWKELGNENSDDETGHSPKSEEYDLPSDESVDGGEGFDPPEPMPGDDQYFIA